MDVSLLMSGIAFQEINSCNFRFSLLFVVNKNWKCHVLCSLIWKDDGVVGCMMYEGYTL